MSTATKSRKRKSSSGGSSRKDAERLLELLTSSGLTRIERDRILGRHDIAHFARAFFPHYCKHDFCEFHYDVYDTAHDTITGDKEGRIARAAPRESAKSTSITLILPLWCICYPEEANKHFILLASDAGTQANERLEEIQNELTDNEYLAEAFPDACGEGSVWRQKEIVTRNNIKVAARSNGGSIRGLRHKQYRPDLLIGDDLENDENVLTPEQRDKGTNWLFKAFLKCGGNSADVFIIGTILHYDSVLARLLNNPVFDGRKYRSVMRWSEATDLWEKWEAIYTDWSLEHAERERAADEYFRRNKSAMLSGTKVLWPESKDYYYLMKRRVAEGPASFDSEYQNEPINPDDCLFREEWFQWFDEDEIETRNMATVAAVDPSMGKAGKHADPSAIVSLGRGADGVLYVLDADIIRRPPDQIIEDCIELHDRRKLSALGVEAVQFQEFFKDMLIKEASYRGKYPPIHGIEQTKDKVMRIQRLQPLVKSGRLRFQKKHKILFEQLKYFPKADHDDGPDALEMAVQMMERACQSYGSGRGDRVSRRNSDNLDRVFG